MVGVILPRYSKKQQSYARTLLVVGNEDVAGALSPLAHSQRLGETIPLTVNEIFSFDAKLCFGALQIIRVSDALDISQALSPIITKFSVIPFPKPDPTRVTYVPPMEPVIIIHIGFNSESMA